LNLIIVKQLLCISLVLYACTGNKINWLQLAPIVLSSFVIIDGTDEMDDGTFESVATYKQRHVYTALLPTGLFLGRKTQNRPSKIVCGLGNSAA
jgi:hypothetical protein